MRSNSVAGPSAHDTRKDIYLGLVVVVAATAGFLFGYDTGVVGGALLFIQSSLPGSNSPVVLGGIVSSLLVGAFVGALGAGRLEVRLGRKGLLFAAGCVYVVGALGSAWAQDALQLISARFILGLAVGAASFIGPMYIAELVPPQIRGATVTLNQLMLTIGIVAAYIVDWAVQGFSDNWRWMLGLGVVPAIILVIGTLWVPRSPRWLVERGRDEDARRVLRTVRSDDEVDAEMDDIKAQSASGGARRSELLDANIRPLLLIGVALAAFQQFVGINTVIYYAPSILKAAGLSNAGALGQTVFIGLTNVIFTIVAVVLLDRVGRRALLLTGTAGLTIALIVLGAFFAIPSLQSQFGVLALLALLVYIASFAIGLGPVFWLMISEIYPVSVKGAAESVATAVNWGTNFLVSFTFLSLVAIIGRSTTFWLYAVVGIVAIWFMATRVPETRGRSLEEIQEELRSGGTSSAAGAS